MFWTICGGLILGAILLSIAYLIYELKQAPTIDGPEER